MTGFTKRQDTRHQKSSIHLWLLLLGGGFSEVAQNE